MPEIKQSWWVVLICFIIITIIGAIFFLNRRQQIKNSASPSPQTSQSSISPTIPAEASTQLFRAKDVPQNTIFDFEASIPSHWQAEYIAPIEALNIYDPSTRGDTNLEKSVIFLRHFSGSSFLTLSTVTIHERNMTTVAERPAVQYVIEKKPNFANFPNQPTWRNIRHTVTDVRITNTNPSLFYVIAERPGNAATYQQFLNTLKF
jgi:hypothetical protein